MKHNDRGAWLFEGGHTFDASLAIAIAQVMSDAGVHDVIDIGCGDGTYTRHLISSGLVAIGYDGNPLTEKVTDGLCFCADFSEPQHLGIYDAALSLEVGEHIPRQYEQVFLDNLSRHADRLIVLSWAIPEQGGFGHVNERLNAHIILGMSDRGWKIDWASTNYLRSRASVAWFKQTVMVFTHGN